MFNFSKPVCDIAGKQIGIFSFGSGMCSSFYSITIRPGKELNTLIDNLSHIPAMLEKRHCVSAKEFEEILEQREFNFNKGNIYILTIITVYVLFTSIIVNNFV